MCNFKAKSLLAVGVVVLLTACAATPIVSVVPAPKNQNSDKPEQLAGIPVRLKAEQAIHIFKWNEEAGKYEEVSITRQVVADYTHLYTVNVKYMPFSSPMLHVAENADNTIKVLQVASTANSNGIVDAVNSVANIKSNAQSAKLTSSAAVASADRTVLASQQALDQLSSTASADARVAAKNALESAKRQAKDAYVAAGLPPPY